MPRRSAHDPEKWVPVFGKGSGANKKLEGDDESKRSHPALARHPDLPHHRYPDPLLAVDEFGGLDRRQEPRVSADLLQPMGNLRQGEDVIEVGIDLADD